MKLGDVVDITFGTRITKSKDEVEQNTENSYPVYGGGDITFYTNKYNRSEETLLLSRFGVSPKCVRIVTGNIFLNDSGMSIKPKDTNLNFNYLKNYLLCNQHIIFNNYASGNAQKNMETNKLLNEFKIPIPPLNIQEQIIHKIEQLNEQSSHYNVYAQTLQSEIDIISETIKNMTNINKINCSVTDVKHNFDSNELTIDLSNIDKYYENVNDLKFDKLVSNRRVIEM
jgi:type I restriction enzyme S subunit